MTQRKGKNTRRNTAKPKPQEPVSQEEKQEVQEQVEAPVVQSTPDVKVEEPVLDNEPATALKEGEDNTDDKTEVQSVLVEEEVSEPTGEVHSVDAHQQDQSEAIAEKATPEQPQESEPEGVVVASGYGIPAELQTKMRRLVSFIDVMNDPHNAPSAKEVDRQLNFLLYFIEGALLQNMNSEENQQVILHTARLFREFEKGCFSQTTLMRGSTVKGFGPRAAEGYLLFAAFSRLAKHGKRANISWDGFKRGYKSRKVDTVIQNMRRLLAQ